MFEFCPQCGNPWSDIELEYQFCKDCGYQSPDDIDCMWDRIRKRINILNGLKGRSEELEELIQEKESTLVLREFELKKMRNKINSERQESHHETKGRMSEKNRGEELFHLNLRTDLTALLKGLWIIIKWAYAAFVFLFLVVIFVVLFGFPIYLIVENGWAGWRTILWLIFSWSLGMVYILFVVNHFKKPGNE